MSPLNSGINDTDVAHPRHYDTPDSVVFRLEKPRGKKKSEHLD